MNRRMSARAAQVGRSTKKISSKRPLRTSSGGSAVMSFAVATMNMRERCSASHVRKVPSTRRDDAAVAVAAAGQRLLDLVEPQHAGRERLG